MLNNIFNTITHLIREGIIIDYTITSVMMVIFDVTYIISTIYI